MIALREHFPEFTPEEYFVWEGQQLERHEYMEGKVYARSGGTIDHGNIAGNFLSNSKFNPNLAPDSKSGLWVRSPVNRTQGFSGSVPFRGVRPVSPDF